MAFPVTTGDLISAADWNANGQWQAWSPTPTNLTVGNGTEIARYNLDGETVTCFYELVFGSTSAVSGDVVVSLPVAARAASIAHVIGAALLVDTGTARYHGTVRSNGSVRAQDVSTYVREVALSSTVPFTWTTNDIFQFTATYEIA